MRGHQLKPVLAGMDMKASPVPVDVGLPAIAGKPLSVTAMAFLRAPADQNCASLPSQESAK